MSLHLREGEKPEAYYPKACIYKSEYLPLTVSTRMSRVIDSVQKTQRLSYCGRCGDFTFSPLYWPMF